MKGFFPTTERDSPRARIPRCGLCGLYHGCKNPKMQVTGDGEKGVLIIAEAPGREEDKQGIQLIGTSGQLFREILGEIDIDLERDCWKTNALICWPGEGNPTPTSRRIGYCRPNLMKTIEELQPRVIVLLGGVAVESLIGVLWKESVGAIGRWVGWKIPCQRLNSWICPTYHPAYLARTNDPVLRIWFKRHIKAAFELDGSPWKADFKSALEGDMGEVDENGDPIVDACNMPPRYQRNVFQLYEPKEVVETVDEIIGLNGPVAFDYETTSLKPEVDGADIVCCAISVGCNDTFVYPWVGEVIEATSRLLKSKCPKIAANLKFEERWTRAKLGHGVNNWAWDTMQAAHVLDNRPGITGLKFQSFVQLGQESYDDHIKPYLQTGANGLNRIHELNLGDLLMYCGMDALLEYELAMKQMEQLGVKRNE